MQTKNRFVIITGMSGAGKSQVVNALEDLGFFCVDNLPPTLIIKFAELLSQTNSTYKKNIALVVDSRLGEFFADFTLVIKQMKRKNMPFEILFLEANTDVLIRRYKETRRRHPSHTDSGLLSDSIKNESEKLEQIRAQATTIIDTSNMSATTLRKKIAELYTHEPGTENMTINILSFGFKYGLPLEADLVLDVRFLPNPFYEAELKKKTGLEQSVIDYINSFEVTKEFKVKITSLLEFLIPNYVKEGKSQLIIAIGCTGGMHRSVHIAESLRDVCVKQNCKTQVIHRDIEKNKKIGE